MALSETSDDQASLHIRIHPHCGACSYIFLPGDAMVALVYNEKSVRAYNALVFTDSDYCQLPKGTKIIFCKKPQCKGDVGADESITLHADCFDLFRNQCNSKDKYRRLWISGTRMYPWRGSLPLNLTPCGANALSHLLSEACGYRRILPQELADVVCSYSQSHIFWRFCSVLRLAQELSSTEFEDGVVSYPVCDLLSWSRGGSPKLVPEGQVADPYVRLTIDSRGIKNIERVSNRQQLSAGDASVPSHVYALEPVAHLSKVSVDFQLGRSRLQAPTDIEINIWSVPTPPDINSVTSFTPSLERTSTRFATISLDPKHCNGISFFVKRGQILAIHGHTKRSPSALSTFNYLSRIHRGRVAWIYIPLAAKDDVVAVVSRTVVGQLQPYAVMLLMMSGNYNIGFTSSMMDVNDIFCMANLPKEKRSTLIYDILYGFPITFLELDLAGVPFSGLAPPDRHAPLPGACLATASLKNVVNIDVFTDKKTGLCRGIMLRYGNEMQRAVGQCRLGFDAVQSYEMPTRIYHASVRHSHPDSSLEVRGVHVAFEPRTDQLPLNGALEWKDCEMKGILEFWFNLEEVVLRIVEDKRV